MQQEAKIRHETGCAICAQSAQLLKARSGIHQVLRRAWETNDGACNREARQLETRSASHRRSGDCWENESRLPYRTAGEAREEGEKRHNRAKALHVVCTHARTVDVDSVTISTQLSYITTASASAGLLASLSRLSPPNAASICCFGSLSILPFPSYSPHSGSPFLLRSVCLYPPLQLCSSFLSFSLHSSYYPIRLPQEVLTSTISYCSISA